MINIQRVVAIITTMNDLEKPFVQDIIESVMTGNDIGQVVICIEQHKIWIEKLIQKADVRILGNDFVELAPAKYIPLTSFWMVWIEVMRKYLYDEASCALIQAEILSTTRCPQMQVNYRIQSYSLNVDKFSMQR